MQIQDSQYIICRKEQDTKMPKRWVNFENYGNWPDTLDHLAISLVDDRYKKLGKKIVTIVICVF